MSFASHFPLFEKLSSADQQALSQVVTLRSAKQGTLVHGGGTDCMGLLVIRSGQLRAYSASGDGREITMYRLFERDICLFSASCMMNSIQFDILISAEKDTQFWVIPPAFYKDLMGRYIEVANYTNQVMATRFTDVMWLVEQVMWKSFDKRLAAFLLEESTLEDTATLKITHEVIASHLGTAREVVTRMLKYFQNEGAVSLGRGTIRLTDPKKLESMTE